MSNPRGRTSLRTLFERNKAPLFYAASSIVVVVATVAVLTSPFLVGGALVASIALLALFLMPRDRMAVVAALGALGLMILVPVQEIGHLGPLKVVVLGGVATLVVVALLRRRGSLGGRHAGLWLFAAYFALLAAATAANVEQSNWTLYQGVLVAGGGLAIVCAMLNEQERRIFGNGVVVMAAAEGAYSLVEVGARLPALWSATASAGAANQIFSGLARSEGTLGNPLPLALLMVVAIALLLRGFGPTGPGFRVLMFAVLIGGSLAAGSRSAFVVSLGLLAFGYRGRLWKVVTIGVYAMVVLLFGLGAAGFFSGRLFQNFATGDSLSHRSGALEAIPNLFAYQDAANLFFGNGYYSARALFDQGMLQQGKFYAVDNQFVLTLVEGGLLTLTVVIALVLRALRAGGPERLALLALVTFFLTFDIMAWPSSIAIFGALVGMSLTRAEARDDSEGRHAPDSDYSDALASSSWRSSSAIRADA